MTLQPSDALAAPAAIEPAASAHVDRPAYFRAKRFLDVLLAAAGLVLLAPLLLLIAVAIKLDSPGPVIFRQRRIGRGLTTFEMLKFRSMRADAGDGPHRDSVRRTALGIRTLLADGRAVFKAPGDPRVTRVGRFLRATCLDELPQLVNVLRGEMSLVGPRPAIDYELAYYEGWHFRRFAVKPGITGYWQVHRNSDVSFAEMMRMDIDYSRRASISSDLQLIIETVPAIIRSRGVF